MCAAFEGMNMQETRPVSGGLAALLVGELELLRGPELARAILAIAAERARRAEKLAAARAGAKS